MSDALKLKSVITIHSVIKNLRQEKQDNLDVLADQLSGVLSWMDAIEDWKLLPQYEKIKQDYLASLIKDDHHE